MSTIPPGPYTASLNDGRVRAADGQCIAQVFWRENGNVGEFAALLEAVVALGKPKNPES